ncbi:MAG: energy transducer TonB [Paludibacteraceae bacterium]|nr:energy transducer TonB [Paludibacteraceae bacterium]
MKKLLLLLLLVPAELCAVNYMMYAGIYGKDCVDDEESPIYGATYSAYPKDLVDAQFPGGDLELSLYLSRNTEIQEVYSGEYDKNGEPLLVTGEVIVEFVIDRCGKPGRFKILQSLTDEQDAEALRVMESLPAFRAATIDGYRVKSAYVAPIRFSKTYYTKQSNSNDYYDDVDIW